MNFISKFLKSIMPVGKCYYCKKRIYKTSKVSSRSTERPEEFVDSCPDCATKARERREREGNVSLYVGCYECKGPFLPETRIVFVFSEHEGHYRLYCKPCFDNLDPSNQKVKRN